MSEEVKQAESFSWGKFFSGIVSPIGYFKTIADLTRILVLVLLCWLAYLAGVKIHSMLAPKKQLPAVFTVSDQIGGEVRNSADQKQQKFGIFNF